MPEVIPSGAVLSFLEHKNDAMIAFVGMRVFRLLDLLGPVLSQSYVNQAWLPIKVPTADQHHPLINISVLKSHRVHVSVSNGPVVELEKIMPSYEFILEPSR